MLTKWNDFGFGDWGRSLATLDSLRQEMERLFADLDSGLSTARISGFGSWPRVNLLDRGSEFVVRAEVPGVEEKDLSVSVDQGTLRIAGERKDVVPEGYSVHRKERGAIRFSRAFTLPCKVDSEKATATLKNGVLELTLPKSEEAMPRQIQVSAG